ncbi:MAG: tRNA 2-thiouridine(34) synthase MnmA [Clostridiales bacterium]|nr:tRNA 2-thiouridine(34) synthase MnmA [Clostridiales bacterium]
MEKVVLGLSGGVDSAVCARLLQDSGYEVHGLYLDIGTEDARKDVVDTAAFLNVPLTVLDISAELEKHVCAPFLESYLRGETPNPCILCNPSVKFKSLADHADAIGAPFIATGHYARSENGMIFKGHPSNDQSYMLSRLRRSQAERLILPLGGYEKVQVRQMAEAYGIPVAHKPDSMEICFIPDKDYIGWISRRAQVPPPGNIVFDGQVIGRHEGIHRYTVGQRLPGLYNERKIYVSAINGDANEIIVSLWEDLFKTEVRARCVSWLIDPPEEPIRGSVRVRHTKWENPDCTITRDSDCALILCDEPVRAPARGQTAALYIGDRLIGGGTIG